MGGLSRKILLRHTLALVVATSVGSVSAAAEPRWPPGRYDYVVIDQSLRDVLKQFASNTGLKMAVSEKVQGEVRGPLPSGSAQEFFDSLVRQFDLDWTDDGAMVYVTAASEQQTKMLALADVPFPELRETLAQARLLDDRHGLTSTMNGKAATVTGPPHYVETVEGVLAMLVRQHDDEERRLQSLRAEQRPAAVRTMVLPAFLEGPTPHLRAAPFATASIGARVLVVMRGASRDEVEVPR